MGPLGGPFLGGLFLNGLLLGGPLWGSRYCRCYRRAVVDYDALTLPFKKGPTTTAERLVRGGMNPALFANYLFHARSLACHGEKQSPELLKRY